MGWPRRPLLHVPVDEGDGPVVVLLHGIASSSVTFEKLIPLLVPTHRVIAIDLLGFGASPVPPDARYTIEEHVAALRRTLRRRLGRRRFVLVGHSMGALIAARYARRYRRRIDRVIVISPPVYLPPEVFGASMDRAAMGLYLRIYEYLRGHQEFTIRGAAGLAALAPIKNLLDITESSWRPFVLSLENSIESQTALSDLAALRMPVDLVYGSLDPLLMPTALRIVEQLRGVTTHRIEGGDHVIRPRIARVVADVLAETVEATRA